MFEAVRVLEVGYVSRMLLAARASEFTVVAGSRNEININEMFFPNVDRRVVQNGENMEF